MSRTIVLVGLIVVVGCGSSNNASGTGGSSATGVAGSSATGSGGSGGSGTGGTDAAGSGGSSAAGAGGTDGTGTGGSGGGAGAASVPLPLACDPAVVRNKGACVTATAMSCANGCGPAKSGFKNCHCYSDVWDCPKCEYLAGGDYSCYALPNPVPSCPPDLTDPSGLNLVATGGSCTEAACMPCGSPTLISYRDSTGMAKAGYCVCVSGTDGAKWSCASVSEWPTQM